MSFDATNGSRPSLLNSSQHNKDTARLSEYVQHLSQRSNACWEADGLTRPGRATGVPVGRRTGQFTTVANDGSSLTRHEVSRCARFLVIGTMPLVSLESTSDAIQLGLVLSADSIQRLACCFDGSIETTDFRVGGR